MGESSIDLGISAPTPFVGDIPGITYTGKNQSVPNIWGDRFVPGEPGYSTYASGNKEKAI